MSFKKLLKGCLSLVLSTCMLFSSISLLQAFTTSPRSYVTNLPSIGLLPDPLIKSDGVTRITTSAEWPAQKTYLTGLLKTCIYGTFPPLPNVSGTIAWGTSNATINISGPGGSFNVSFTLYYPSYTSGNKYPVVILTWVGTGNASSAPGNGFVGISAGTGEYGNCSSAFPGYTWGDVMKRAWISGCIAKWLKNQSWVDSRYIATSGHSRGAKVAFTAAAFFDEITGGAPNCGGTGGEIPFRYVTNEYNTEVWGPGGTFVGDLFGGTSTGFYDFHGRENKLPVDQNTLAAICAPKPIILGTAVNDILSGPWGIMQSYRSAKRVFDLLGMPNKVGVRMDWGGHHMDSIALAAYCQFLNWAWGRTTTAPIDQYVNLFRHNYTFDSWKTAHPSDTINPANYATHPVDMSDLLKNSNNATITTTSEWDQKKTLLKQQISALLGTGPADSSFTSSNTNFGAAADGILGSPDLKPQAYSTLGRQNILVKNSSGRTIFNAYLCYPTDRSTYPVTVFINNSPHPNGFCPNGTTRELMWSHLEEMVINKKIAVLGYDVMWTGLRIEEGQNFYTRFPNWTVMGKDIEDVQYLITALLDSSQNPRSGAINRQQIYATGYGVSGGAIALLSALYDDRIAGVVPIAAVTPMRTATLAVEGVRSLSHLNGLIPKLGFFVNDDLYQNDANKNRLPFDFNEVIAAIAPRPVGIVTPRYSINVLVDQVSTMVTNSKQVYSLYNKSGNLNHTITETFDCIDRWESGQAVNNQAASAAVLNLGTIFDGAELKGSASVASLPPNGTSTSVITAEIRDRMGRKTNYSGSAVFSITSGSGSGQFTTATTVSISNGLATATLRSTTTPGDVIVKIAVSGLNDYTIKIPVSSPDGTAPAAVNNLATGTITYNSVVLNWSASGDDGTTGTATSYDVRYMTGTPITSGNFASATAVSGAPTPRASGSSETMTVSNLSGNTQYYFAIKVADEGGNQSGISNVVSGTTPTPPADAVAPAQITLSAGSATQTAITLSWTAVGDDGTTGTANSYDIRYSNTQITDANWGSATPITGEPAPKVNGGAETMVINGLTENTQYYFAIKAGDEIPNMGPLSNIASARTLSQAGTVAEWHLDDGSGSSAADSSGNSNTGTLNGSPAWVTGKTNTGLQFDGLNTYVSVTDSNSLDLTTGISIEAWVKCGDISQDGSTRRVLDKGAYLLGASDKSYFKIFKGGVASSVEKTWTSADVNVWHHLVGTYDGTAVKLYQDGVLVNQTATTGNIDTNTSVLNIGRQSSGAGRFIGIIDEVKIYNRALTLAEVVEHYNPASADTTAPAQVNTIATSNLQQNSITLTWTAVGDDGTTGTAASYSVRYQTYTITSGNFASATPATGAPTPQASGGSETLTVSNLTADTTYYFAIKVADEVPNTSVLSNVVTGKTASIPPAADTTAPAQVNTLATSNLQQTAITLTWTAVGDDGTTGTAASYDIRYMLGTPITSGNFASAIPAASAPTPQIAGTQQTLTVSNLTADTTYYFAMKILDEIPNTSVLSNVSSGKTAAIPPAADTTAPAQVNTLATSNPTTTSIMLSWTSVGDDGTTGTAASYDIRYMLGTPITSGNFASATPVTGEPTPQAAGGGETLTISNLTANTTYYFAMKILDEVPNTSVLSNVSSGKTAAIPPVADTTAPAQVNTLATSNLQQTAITLSWTSVGDDGTTGTAASYDIRYSNTIIDNTNFANATPVTGEPTPRAAGGSEVLIVSNLTADTTYYFAMKVLDEVPNTSVLSNVVSGKTASIPPVQDTTAPAQVNTLATNNLQQTSITLTWTAVGDDGTTGTANSYDIRYRAGSVITSSNFASATPVTGVPSPQAAGGSETLTVSNLTANTTYYFAIKIADEVPNTSVLSNVVSGKTAAIPPAADTTAPAQVNTLTTGNLTQTTITLSWTSVGDDDATGTAASYDIRYLAGSPITGSNFATANQVSNEPAPRAAGNGETVTVTNLSADITYYFAMKVLDEVPNTSVLSNVVSGKTAAIPPVQDTIAPATINTLATSNPTQTSVTLNWIAVGDDGSNGTATIYDIRYMADSAITGSNFASATQVNAAIQPQAAGSNESVTVDNLNINTTYYFAIKVGDEIPNWSGVSNSPSGKTSAPAPDTTVPAQINTLATSDPTTTSITLNWTAVGDDANVGTAAEYDIRYMINTPLTSSNWNNATQISVEPAPQESGNGEALIINNLTANTAYYFGIKVGDEIPNWSSISNIVIGNTNVIPDTIAPSAINNLNVVDKTSTTITVSWTSVGDDGTTGTAASYDIRYIAGTPLTASNFATAIQVTGEPTPKAYGNSESITIGNLSANTTYYIGIKVADEVPNTSGLSNVVNVKTQPAPSSDTNPLNTVSYLTASSLPDRKIQLNWLGESASTETIRGYNIYMGSGNNPVNYNVPAYTVDGGSITTLTINSLTADREYRFVVRTVDTNGNEDTNTNIIAITAVEEYTTSMLTIGSLSSGMKVSGTEITLSADSILGDVSNLSEVRFEYKKAGDTNWTEIITADETGTPNPDTSYPYYIKWDVSKLTENAQYNVRIISVDNDGIEDTTPGYVTVTISDTNPDVEETGTYKRQRLDNRKRNIVKMGIPDSNLVAQVIISSGILNSTTAIIRLEANPAIAPEVSSNLVLVGCIYKIEMESGQTQFTQDIEITLPYKDTNSDNRVDDNDISSSKLIVCTYNDTTDKWEKVTTTTIDKTNRQLTAKTKHLSYYGVFAVLQSDLNTAHVYPNPFKPSLGHTSITFANLTSHTKIKIFSVSGELVYEEDKDTPTGELSWNVLNASQERIASGVYIYMITNNAGQTKKGKLAIIR